MVNTPHLFGGDWTEQKLASVRDYLAAYTTALKFTRFRLAYIDAFAGTGYRTKSRPTNPANDLFTSFREEESQEFMDGSARIALQVKPRFHKYIFIEKHRKRFTQLEKLKEEFPDKRDDIILVREEANAYLQKICLKRDWSTRRATLFLDPYGMQVEWATIKAIAATKAIDLWILFPLGVAVSRLLTKSGKINAARRQRLDTMFGATDWFEAFYRPTVKQSFFGDITSLEKVCDFDSIGRYFVKRLEDVFVRVAQNPRSLYNSRNVPLYLLCFAAGNPKGAPIAIEIADHILRRN